MLNSVPELSILVSDVAALSTFCCVDAKDMSIAVNTCVPPNQPQLWPKFTMPIVKYPSITQSRICARYDKKNLNIDQILLLISSILSMLPHRVAGWSCGWCESYCYWIFVRWLDKDRLQLLFCFLDICVIFWHLAFKFQCNQQTILDVPQAHDDMLSHICIHCYGNLSQVAGKNCITAPLKLMKMALHNSLVTK